MLGLLRRATARHRIAIGGDDPEGAGCMTIVNQYYITGNTMLGRDADVARQIEHALIPARRRHIGYRVE